MVCLFFLSSKVLLESAFHQLMENGENLWQYVSGKEGGAWRQNTTSYRQTNYLMYDKGSQNPHVILPIFQQSAIFHVSDTW